MNDYFILSVRDWPGTLEEFLSEYCFARGALGLSEALPFEQPEGEETVFTKLSAKRALNVYFDARPSDELLLGLSAACPDAKLEVTGEANRDWLAEWKKGFKPFALAGGHWVIPSWCEPPREAKHKIWIDPGMAFGTGTHETTQLVAEALLPLNFESLLDVGTGTGILAILGAQLGARQIRGTELDADARRTARENFAANNLASIELDDTQVEDLKEKYDVVVANIIDGVLVRIQDALKARVRAGGWLLLSGIILEREKDFLSGFNIPGQWTLRAQKGDWLLYGTRL